MLKWLSTRFNKHKAPTPAVEDVFLFAGVSRSGPVKHKLSGEISVLRIADLPGRGKSTFCQHALLLKNLLRCPSLKVVVWDFKGQGSFDWLSARFPGRVRVANIRKGVTLEHQELIEQVEQEFKTSDGTAYLVVVDEAHMGLVSYSKPANDFERFCNRLTVLCKEIAQMGRSEHWILVAITLSPAKTAAEIADSSIGCWVLGMVTEPELRKRIPGGNPDMLLDSRLSQKNFFCVSFEGEMEIVKFEIGK
jgi:hypothetical protein